MKNTNPQINLISPNISTTLFFLMEGTLTSPATDQCQVEMARSMRYHQGTHSLYLSPILPPTLFSCSRPRPLASSLSPLSVNNVSLYQTHPPSLSLCIYMCMCVSPLCHSFSSFLSVTPSPSHSVLFGNMFCIRSDI